MLTKSRLAIQLSKLKAFSSPELLSEQYPTDSEVAADFLWNAYMMGDIKGKVIADLGCGTGILGIGCLLLGAGRVYFVDSDEKCLASATENLDALGLEDYEIIKSDIGAVNLECDVVVQNPPFGTKLKHADMAFLLKAFETAGIVYSVHKASSVGFVEKLGIVRGFKVTNILRYEMPLKHSHTFHRKRIHRIDVACFRLEKQPL